MNKNFRKISVVSLLFCAAISFSACTKDSTNNSKTSMNEKTKKSVSKSDTDKTSDDENKIISYQRGEEGSSSYKKTILTFFKGKLVQEKTTSNFSFTNSNQSMSSDEYEKIIEQNKISFKNIEGIEYDAKIIPNDIGQTVFTIDYNKVDIDKVSWLTSFSNKTTIEEAKDYFEKDNMHIIK